MTTFVDTSALYALLDADDPRHADVAAIGEDVLATDALTHGLVVAETGALVQSRLGMDAFRTLGDELLADVEIVWPDAGLYERARTAALAAGRREVSLVDWASFELMRERRITRAFVLDRHFGEQGFEVLP